MSMKTTNEEDRNQTGDDEEHSQRGSRDHRRDQMVSQLRHNAEATKFIPSITPETGSTIQLETIFDHLLTLPLFRKTKSTLLLRTDLSIIR